MLLRTYIDDSADQAQEKAVVAGAYVGFYHQWNKLQKKWRKRLKQDGVEYFRAADYYGLHGPFSVFANPITYPKPLGRQAAKALLDDLEEIIHESQVMGIAVCVDMQTFREIRESEPHAAVVFHSDAFEVALQALIGRVAEIVRDEWSEHRKVAFICDDSSASSRIAKLYAEFKELSPHLAEFMGALVHQDDKLVPPLQTADMMAHLAKGRFIDWLEDPMKSTFTDNTILRERLSRLSVHQIAVWDRKYMLAVLKHEVERRGLKTSV